MSLLTNLIAPPFNLRRKFKFLIHFTGVWLHGPLFFQPFIFFGWAIFSQILILYKHWSLCSLKSYSLEDSITVFIFCISAWIWNLPWYQLNWVGCLYKSPVASYIIIQSAGITCFYNCMFTFWCFLCTIYFLKVWSKFALFIVFAVPNTRPAIYSRLEWMVLFLHLSVSAIYSLGEYPQVWSWVKNNFPPLETNVWTWD